MSLNASRPYNFSRLKERTFSNHDGHNDQYRHFENVERKKEALPKNSKHAAADMIT
jgi:hypothetical protein